MNAIDFRQLAISSMLGEFGDAWGLAQRTAGFVHDYLVRFGYLDPSKTFSTVGFLLELPAAIRRVQAMLGNLTIDGIPGAQTIRAMQLPRCANSDAQSIGATINKWGLKEITYGWRADGFLPRISRNDQTDIFAEAMKGHREVCGLDIRPIKQGETPNILIGCSISRRDDFGEVGNVLAKCYLPAGDKFRGQVALTHDAAESWLYAYTRGSLGIWLLPVDAHEGGHALGMDHGGNGLMKPTYDPEIPRPLPGYDQQQLQLRYGPRLASGTEPTTPATPKPVAPKFVCRVTAPDGATYEATDFRRVA